MESKRFLFVAHMEVGFNENWLALVPFGGTQRWSSWLNKTVLILDRRFYQLILSLSSSMDLEQMYS